MSFINYDNPILDNDNLIVAFPLLLQLSVDRISNKTGVIIKDRVANYIVQEHFYRRY